MSLTPFSFFRWSRLINEWIHEWMNALHTSCLSFYCCVVFSLNILMESMPVRCLLMTHVRVHSPTRLPVLLPFGMGLGGGNPVLLNEVVNKHPSRVSFGKTSNHHHFTPPSTFYSTCAWHSIFILCFDVNVSTYIHIIQQAGRRASFFAEAARARARRLAYACMHPCMHALIHARAHARRVSNRKWDTNRNMSVTQKVLETAGIVFCFRVSRSNQIPTTRLL